MTEDAVAAGRRGVITVEDDGRQRLEFRRSWPDPPEDVWSALTAPERMPRWIGTYEGERQPGATGTFTMTHEPGEPAGQPMRIVECDPPRRLVVQVVEQADWRFEVDLVPADGGTELVFRQWFAPEANAVDFAGGWHWYLDKLDAEIGGGDPPAEWETFWAQVGPGYRSAGG
jgi:uncharacterized protein YndB with AHSA1/START domain